MASGLSSIRLDDSARILSRRNISWSEQSNKIAKLGF